MTHRLAMMMCQERVANSRQRERGLAAAAERPARPSLLVTRRAVGRTLVRFGAWLGGPAPGETAARPA
jgi:hypothetical protein